MVSTLCKRGAATTLLLLMSPVASRASTDTAALPQFANNDYAIVAAVSAAAIIAIIYGLILRAQVLSLSPGTEAMQRVGAAIRTGAYAYLSKQVKTMLPLVAALAVILFLIYRSQAGYTLATAAGLSLAFLAGVGLSYAAGYIGMGMAVSGNQRTANQALSTYKGALEAAFRSGAVAGMMTVGLALLGATSVILIFKSDATKVLLGFGFGGSLAALFMRVGGGIFTKAADVGADLVGKVEKSIPEDDPRNPATIADNVGDNVGDCAGMAADVFESYLVTLVAAVILGAAVSNRTSGLTLILFPLIIHGAGILASIVGIALMKGREDRNLDPLRPINAGLWKTAGTAIIIIFACVMFIPGLKDGITVQGKHYGPLLLATPTLIGILLALVISKLTEHFTGTDGKPVNEAAHASQTGAATLLLSGFSSALESAAWATVAIVVALWSIVLIFGDGMFAAYGIALTGLGLLTTTGYVLAMDTFGPISDNANGIFEMSGALKNAHSSVNLNGSTPILSGGEIVSKLDSAGNTTKALTKGFAIASAVIAAVALFRSFMADSHLGASDLSLASPTVFIGLLIGGAAPFLFCSFAINAVSRAAFELVQEVRRQFRDIPGLMEGTGTPEYDKCVAISTSAAQRELLGPGVLAIALPILVGFAFGLPALGGYLAGAIVSGQLMAVLLANSGGIWDNAKKKIEDGLFGGKGTDEHKAAVIGDTVGDPFKDTAGPALNPLIKVMNLVGVLLAGVLSQPISIGIRASVIVISIAALTAAIAFSKRGSLANLSDKEAHSTEEDNEPLLPMAKK